MGRPRIDAYEDNLNLPPSNLLINNSRSFEQQTGAQFKESGRFLKGRGGLQHKGAAGYGLRQSISAMSSSDLDFE